MALAACRKPAMAIEALGSQKWLTDFLQRLQKKCVHACLVVCGCFCVFHIFHACMHACMYVCMYMGASKH